ncbi:hypothetical protein T484DRAFT_1776302 [Baffinella frigidus]|nr:hypothetical protein T484DRAFT_1776302 [Cryptophyta sp. CCMP2293]
MGLLGKMFGKGGAPPPPEPVAEKEEDEEEEEEEEEDDENDEVEERGQQESKDAGESPSAQDATQPLPAKDAPHVDAAPQDPSSRASTAQSQLPKMEPAAGTPPELEISPDTLPEPTAPAHQHHSFDGAVFDDEVHEALTARSHRPERLVAPAQAWAQPNAPSDGAPRDTALDALRKRMSAMFDGKDWKPKRDIQDVAADMLGEKPRKRRFCACCGLRRGRVDATPPG